MFGLTQASPMTVCLACSETRIGVWPADIVSGRLRPTPRVVSIFSVDESSGVAMASGGAVYRSVLTHGFTVDGDGRKMSKSLGNIIPGQEKAMQELGADVCAPCGCAAADYRNEISA